MPNVDRRSMARCVCAMLVGNGNGHEAASTPKHRWNDSTPEVALVLKAAVAAGKTTDATWAKPLVNQTIANDFLALLRPADHPGQDSRAAEGAVQLQGARANGGRRPMGGWASSKPKPVTQAGLRDGDPRRPPRSPAIIVLTRGTGAAVAIRPPNGWCATT